MQFRWIFIVILVLLLATGGWWFFAKRQAPAPLPVDSGTETAIEMTPEQKDEVAKRNRALQEGQENDEDQDGLNKEQELSAGTSDLETDSDADGLSDYAEVTRWKTDPTKPDTDGDGFADLVEINNGYSPI